MSNNGELHPNSLAALVPTQWKPGETGNPEGGRAHNKELKALKKLTTEQVVEVGSFLLENNIQSLQNIVEDALNNANSEHSALKVWIARVVLAGSKKGDANALNIVLDRLVGKVRQGMDFTGLNMPQVVVELPSNGREVSEPRDSSTPPAGGTADEVPLHPG